LFSFSVSGLIIFLSIRRFLIPLTMTRVALLVLASALALVCAMPADIKPIVNEDMVNYINSLGTTWTASTDQGSFVSGVTRDEVSRLMGVKEGGEPLPHKRFSRLAALPDSFDARTNWPNCPTIGQIRDQSACGSCWAFGAVEAMSDRYCTFKISANISISADDLLACCNYCGDGCAGGYPSMAWRYWTSSGLVTEQCDPYPFPSCDHHVANSKNPCPSQEYPTPSCKKTCSDGENWNSVIHKGSRAYSISGETEIMNEIYQYGPVEGAFTVYEDFVSYKSGVYQHTTGGVLGGHAIKILGWGVDNGVKYWIVANSWNPSWGNQGFFWIRRGTDECGIEDACNAGVPSN